MKDLLKTIGKIIKNHKVLCHYIGVWFLTFLVWSILSHCSNMILQEIIRIMMVVVVLYSLQFFKIGMKGNKSLIQKYKDQFLDKIFLFGFVIYMALFALLVMNMTNYGVSDVLFAIYNSFIFAACWEEILMRGCYFDELRKKHSIIISALFCGLIFITLHFPQMIFAHTVQPNEFLIVALQGMYRGTILCIVNLLSENIFITAICHFNFGYLSDIFGLLVTVPLIILKAVNKVTSNP